MADANINVLGEIEGLMYQAEPLETIFKAIEKVAENPGIIRGLASHGATLALMLHNDIDVLREQIQEGRQTSSQIA